MDKIYRKINDNRVSIPVELWESLNIRKGDTVEVIEVDNGILIQKVLDPTVVNEVRESFTKEDPEDKKYMLRLGKTKNVYIPKPIYDKFELAGKRFTTSYTKELDENGEAEYCLIVSENGNFTYRKENAVSLPFLFPNTEFEEGQIIYLYEYNENELKFKIDYPKLKETKKIYTNMDDLRNMMLDNNHNRFKEEKEEENKIAPEGPILNFKVRIGSGYVIYIPNKIFLKIKEIGTNFEYILNKSNDNGVRLLMSFTKYGTNSTQKSGALSLKSLMSPLELIPGEELSGEYDTVNNVMSLDFPENSYVGSLEGEKVIDTSKVEPPIKSAEIKEENLVLKTNNEEEIKFPVKELIVEDEEENKEEQEEEKIEFKNDGNEEDNYVEQSKDEEEISEEEFQMMASDNSFIQDTLEKYGNVDEMIKDEDFDIREEYYKHQIEKYKMNNTVFNFITKEQLPKGQRLCYKCSRQLTPSDNSMINGSRICNKCKTNELKRLFKPIKELAKIREEKRK